MPATTQQKLISLTSMVTKVPGDFAEIGVYRGSTFCRLVPIAKSQKKQAHAYDSFIGMADNGKNDFGQYPKGQLSIGGTARFRQLMTGHGINQADYTMYEGFIPDCFTSISPSQQYSFIYLDVDQYEPTKVALEWCWPRIPTSGILLLDDWFPHKKGLASLAIRQWMEANKESMEEVDYSDHQLALRKL